MDEDFTIGIIKPNCFDKKEEIIKDIESRGFSIENKIEETFDKLDWETLYFEHKGKSHFDPLIEFMASGKCVVMKLKYKNGDTIKRWREEIGPTNAAKEKELSPNCLRAIYGDPEILRKNGFHGSDSKISAHYENILFFNHLKL
jgi:nucleoside diphosphate kinase